MSLLSNAIAIPQKGGYDLTDSVRFRSSASAYLTRTPTTVGNRKKYTISVWVKRGALGAGGQIIQQREDVNSSQQFALYFLTGDTLRVLGQPGTGGSDILLDTTAVYRDPSAWYHIVAAMDTTQATASDRTKLYVNGEQITSFASTTYPTLNLDTAYNNTVRTLIGCQRPNSSATLNGFFDGYITEFNSIDGQALTPSDFGEYDATTGVWKPKEYTGSYGTNGFYLPMKATTQAEGFNTVTYTGTGTDNLKVNGVGFSPDFVWIKDRSNARDSVLFDSVRGATNYLRSSTTGAEGTASDTLKSFNSDGFTLGTNVANNGSSETYVAWCWEAGGTAVANTDGDIASQVSANTDKGFSVVTWTGTSSAGYVGHGLGVTPEVVICKARDTTTSFDNWYCYFQELGAANKIILDRTDAASATSTWDSTSPNSTGFYLRNSVMNLSPYTYVAYCFAPKAGFSKFGSYTGTGSAGNSITGLGFRPAFLMIKRTDSTGNWIMLDNTRSPDNSPGEYLLADSSNQENVTTIADLDSDGFTLNATGSGSNASGGSYIYMAFADTRDFQFNFDASGNKNNFTPNNINSNAYSETTYDIMSDVPTLTDEDTSNFATLNPIHPATNQNISQGNLRTIGNAVNHVGVIPTILPTTGKWYIEFDITTANTGGFGFTNVATPITSFPGASTGYWWIYGALTTGYAIHNQTSYASYTDTRFNTGNLGQMALDFDNGKVWVGSNNVWINATNGTNGDPSTGANPTWTMTTGVQYYPFWEHAATTTEFNLNFGQRPFAYTPPTGFKKLNTYNLPDSAVKDGSQYMNPVTYTGNGSTQSITGVGFSPDLVWLKNRTASYNHALNDSVRGAGKTLESNTTNSEFSYSPFFTSLDSDGFSLAGGIGQFNLSGNSYVAWNWRGSDSAAVSNTAGTITSTVSANPTAGFSIVSWVADNSASTRIGHGLGTTPKIAIIKNRNTVSNWQFYTTIIDGSYDFLYLNLTNAKSDSGLSTFTSTTIAAGGTSTNTDNMIAYCFAEAEGFSKFGSYTGNGSTDGPFIYTGFRPAWVLWKRTDTSGNSWRLKDSTRSPYNEALLNLFPNSVNAENSDTAIDFVSNGFKNRSTGVNVSGATYIYMAFAENPFKNSLAR